ncbi:MAG: hypothetical protein M3O36_00545 [Myxococcota bacterium]|nr:hypothetical protein [Myxococcota bacterium]
MAVGAFTAFAVVFVASSAMQIVRAVFFRETLIFSSSVPGSTSEGCAQRIASLLRALDRANAKARAEQSLPPKLNDDASLVVFRQGLHPEWDDRGAIERACASSAAGLESWAAVSRLRAALEEWIRRERIALEPLRRDVIPHLPANLR